MKATPTSPPLVSLIVVCRNAAATLPATLESIWTQTAFPGLLELIIIDGASTDGSAAWLQARVDRIHHLTSEADAGVYAAMNKGLLHARGTWVYFIGADDTLAHPDTFARLAPQLRATSADVVAGEARYSDGRIYRFIPPIHPARRNFLHHQATLYRRARFADNGGGFDARLRVAADYELNLRWWRHGAQFETHDHRIAECTAGGLSDAGNWITYREEIRARHHHLPRWRCLLWDAGSIVRYLRKKIIVRHHRHAR